MMEEKAASGRAALLAAFERRAEGSPDAPFAVFTDADEVRRAYSCGAMRAAARRIARAFADEGVRAGDVVPLDLANGPLFAALVPAAAYGRFVLAPLNRRLAPAEKRLRLAELERGGLRVAGPLAGEAAVALEAWAFAGDDAPRPAALFGGARGAGRARDASGQAPAEGAACAGACGESGCASAVESPERNAGGCAPASFGLEASDASTAAPQSDAAAGCASASPESEATAGSPESAAAALPGSADAAVAMFTSGTTGTPKAVLLTWENLVSSAQASNTVLSDSGEGAWQATLPFYHIGGLQVLLRSVLNETPLLVYERFDARRVLSDALEFRATHISVVDKMLQDMLDAAEFVGARSNGEERDGSGRGEGVQGDAPSSLALVEPRAGGTVAGAASDGAVGVSAAAISGEPADAPCAADFARALAGYRCILLGGAALNPRTTSRARRAGIGVYASYGMTDTSSQIANALIDEDFSGDLALLPGYEARIENPDDKGFGMLAVRGGGVFGGYLNADAPFTEDGFFLTGDTAALRGGRIAVKERTSDMFVSGGENIYPAEVACALEETDGVAAAHVFGVEDSVWGRRPAAVVERSRADVDERSLRRALAGRLSKLTMPDAFLVVDDMPRSGIGKTDRAAAESLFAGRIEVCEIRVHRVRMPFREPFVTADATLSHRDAAVIEAIDHAGRAGLGECSSFETAWYLPETLDDDVRFIADVLAPALMERSFSHPREVAAFLGGQPGARSRPMACAAVEFACWDLHARIAGRPLWAAVREEYRALCDARRFDASALSCAARFAGDAAFVPAGASVGIAGVRQTCDAVRAACAQGYRRVKLKVSARAGAQAARAVAQEFPEVMLTLDANGSFVSDDDETLRGLDGIGARWIEEPLARPADAMRACDAQCARLARLQRTLRTPVCVDESFFTADEAECVLRHDDLGCIAMKIPKFGGIEPALEFLVRAQAAHRTVWVGGMYDTGIARRVCAAFETLPGVDVPGDIGAPTRYLREDVVQPPYEVKHGEVRLNGPGFESGAGCAIDRAALERALVTSAVVKRA